MFDEEDMDVAVDIKSHSNGTGVRFIRKNSVVSICVENNSLIIVSDSPNRQLAISFNEGNKIFLRHIGESGVDEYMEISPKLIEGLIKGVINTVEAIYLK